ncbi:MAG: hypothetical protein NDJ89_07755 [Oligoflexia bacterium]|nr:hypothetical protein [Oligoflexia bacterium]
MKTKKKQILSTLIPMLTVMALLGTQAPAARAAEVAMATVAGMVATMATAGTAVMAGVHKELLAETAPDALRFLATRGEQRSQLLSSVLEQTRREIEAREGSSRRFSDEELARIIVNLSLGE